MIIPENAGDLKMQKGLEDNIHNDNKRKNK